MNLVRNGMEAMANCQPGMGALTIQTRDSADAMVEVAVRDTGHGFSPEIAKHIFHPFFTTKPEGMGMGLSISRSLVEAHGGRLWATPNPGGGAIFRFTLPTATGVQTDER